VGARFQRARRLRRAAEEARARQGEEAARHVGLADALLRVGQPDADVAAILAGLSPDLRGEAERALEEPAPRPQQGPTKALPWRAYTSADGWTILVGRDARGNDELTMKHARPGDLFLHVRAAAGSHVIVPTQRGKTVPRDTLLDAAQLACHFSERRAADRNEVDYTPRRYVRKPRGSPAGLVRLERSRTLTVARNESQRERLLASPGRAEGQDPG
ncbi:MAG: NFACT RNA binding domain-containing protein, partial [Planctomycetota bacterium]|nr:NFACT RNA binding domain-containing protein [Planctomycetota bacterium]